MPRVRTLHAIALGLSAALVGLDGGTFGPALPALRAGLSLDDPRAAWLLSAYVVGTLVGTPSNAWIAARFGASRALSLALGVYALGAFVFASSHGALFACAARWTQGLGAGSLLSIATAALALRVDPSRRGRAIVLLSLAYGMAFVIASGSASALASSWRALYAGLGLFALAVSIVFATLRGEDTPSTVPFDLRGFVLWTGAVASLAVVIPQLRGGATDATMSLVALSCALALFALAIVNARRVEHSFVPLGLLRAERLRAASALSIASGSAQVFAVSLPSFAVVVVGVDAARVSLWSLPFVFAGLAGTVVSAMVIDRVGARLMVAVTGVAVLAGAVALSTVPPSRGAFIAISALVGAGLSTLSGGPIRHLAGVVEGPDGPRAQALLSLVTNLGLLASSALYGSLASPRGDIALRALGMRHGSAAVASLFALALLSGLRLARRQAA